MVEGIFIVVLSVISLTLNSVMDLTDINIKQNSLIYVKKCEDGQWVRRLSLESFSLRDSRVGPLEICAI